MSDSRAYLNGFGASASLLAAVGVAFALLAGTFAYRGGPDSLGPGDSGVAELPSAAGPGASAAAAFASVPGSVASLSEAATLVGAPSRGGTGGPGGGGGGGTDGGGGSGSPQDPVTQVVQTVSGTLNGVTGIAYPLIDGLNPLNGGGVSLNLGNQSIQLLQP